MSEQKHTPGPYEIVPSETPNEFLIYGSDDTVGHIAEVHGHNAEANAALFAQAPAIIRQRGELVKVLGEIRDMTQCDCLTDEHEQCVVYENMLVEISEMVDETIGECKKEPT